jgi:hypothetical protein
VAAAAHRRAGYGDRQGADGNRLVDHDQDFPLALEAGERSRSWGSPLGSGLNLRSVRRAVTGRRLWGRPHWYIVLSRRWVNPDSAAVIARLAWHPEQHVYVTRLLNNEEYAT